MGRLRVLELVGFILLGALVDGALWRRVAVLFICAGIALVAEETGRAE